MGTSLDSVALRYLRYLALRNGGYTRRGVKGWALREDVDRAVQLRLAECLPNLHRRGLLDREDVRAPGLRRAVWLYRITQRGADRVSEEADLPRRVVVRPLRLAERDTDAAIHIPAGPALALRELRRAMEAQVECAYVPDQPGWRTVQNLRAQLCENERARPCSERDSSRFGWGTARLEHGEPVRIDCGDQGDHNAREDARDSRLEIASLPDDLGWLVRTGLAMKFTWHQPARRKVVSFRITNLGGVVLPLEWSEPE